jgi:hypothetical protein
MTIAPAAFGQRPAQVLSFATDRFREVYRRQ